MNRWRIWFAFQSGTYVAVFGLMPSSDPFRWGFAGLAVWSALWAIMPDEK